MTRGRPPKRLADDPDRHIMAIAVAYWALGASRRGGCEIAIASVDGWPVGRNSRRGKGGHGLNLIDWQYVLKEPWCRSATIQGRARGLRQKLKKALKDPTAATWLQEMAELHLLALGHQRGRARDQAEVEAEIMRRAEALGETAYAGEKLRAMAELSSRK
jgi:hypothetical protein